jgi:hypothetical protein
VKRAKVERWEETYRREVGVVVGDVRNTGANFTLLYMVTECRKVRGRVVEWRERLVHGKTLYQAKQGLVSTSAMLEVVATGVKALSHIARIDDERATPGGNDDKLGAGPPPAE